MIQQLHNLRKKGVSVLIKRMFPNDFVRRHLFSYSIFINHIEKNNSISMQSVIRNWETYTSIIKL